MIALAFCFLTKGSILGVNEFWFWNDQKIYKKPAYYIEDNFTLESKPYRVRFRGWFVNDEVLLHKWYFDGSKDKPWEMVFETLLRCGGNMVIPGTDKNAGIYHKLAADMGLYITHHHAEPLGAKMFAREYPDLKPSFNENEKLFIKLWEEAIERQKGEKIIWNLGFRGQGDYPFWENDSRYDTPKSRGDLIAGLIKRQYDMVKTSDVNAVTCSNLYGETMELYNQGVLHLPDDVIKIWADNGYGKMVSRRQENHNPRIKALPNKDDSGRNGIYYHVSFYDLQAGNHITMLPNKPEFIKEELTKVLEHGCSDYWLINCSNVKPHTYYLDFIAKMWRDGDISVESHSNEYLSMYYGKENLEYIKACFKLYFGSALKYGNNEDEHAGEQFANHISRILISDYIKGNNLSQYLGWAVDAENIGEQISWYESLCKKAANDYKIYLNQCEETLTNISESGKELFKESLLLQAKIYYHSFFGANLVCKSLNKALKGEYKDAFYLAGKARDEYIAGDMAMREAEGKNGEGFYANECLTDIKQTAWVIEGLMSYLRNMGEGPHFYEWQREYLYAPEDRRVLLIMNMDNHLNDLNLYELMKEKYGRDL